MEVMDDMVAFERNIIFNCESHGRYSGGKIKTILSKSSELAKCW